MKIIITNDDGIHAPGLVVAETIAKNFLDKYNSGKGEVFVVAPAFEKSGHGHAISYSVPVHCSKVDDYRFAVNGTPADCVIAAVSSLVKDTPDLIISGVNFGRNLAEDVMYSGTVGGAMQASIQGVKAISLSQAYDGGEGFDQSNMWESAKSYGHDVINMIFSSDYWDYGLFYNVNFPPRLAKDFAVKLVSQGSRIRSNFKAVEKCSPNGKHVHWIVHDVFNSCDDKNTDVTCVGEGNISVTPMRADFTDYKVLKDFDSSGFQ